MVLSLEDMSAFGAVLHVAGSVLIVYGQTMVKQAHCIEDSSSVAGTWLLPAGHQPRWRRPDGKWRPHAVGSKTYAACGWSLFAVGNLMRFVSMRFAAQTVLSGLGSLQFVVIPVASRSLLGIKPQVSTGVGVGTVLLGNLLIIMYGPPETAFTLHQLRSQWATPQMKLFLLMLGACLASLHILWRYIHRRRRQAEAEQRAAHIQRQRRREREREWSVDALEPERHIWEVPGSKQDDIASAPGDPNTLRMFVAALLFSAVSSFVGAWSVLFSKSLTYVVAAFPASLADGYSWFTAAAFLGTAGYWVRQSNKGLKLYPATLIMPLMQAFWMAMSVLEGMIYFDEMRTLEGPALGALLLGLVMAIMGAVAMGLAGYFNERPHSTTGQPPSPPRGTLGDVEAQPFLASSQYKDSSQGGMSPAVLQGRQPEGEVLVGGADGLSSPVYRERDNNYNYNNHNHNNNNTGGVTPGSLSMALHMELSRVAANKQARARNTRVGEGSSASGATSPRADG